MPDLFPTPPSLAAVAAGVASVLHARALATGTPDWLSSALSTAGQGGLACSLALAASGQPSANHAATAQILEAVLDLLPPLGAETERRFCEELQIAVLADPEDRQGMLTALAERLPLSARRTVAAVDRGDP